MGQGVVNRSCFVFELYYGYGGAQLDHETVIHVDVSKLLEHAATMLTSMGLQYLYDVVRADALHVHVVQRGVAAQSINVRRLFVLRWPTGEPMLDGAIPEDMRQAWIATHDEESLDTLGPKGWMSDVDFLMGGDWRSISFELDSATLTETLPKLEPPLLQPLERGALALPKGFTRDSVLHSEFLLQYGGGLVSYFLLEVSMDAEPGLRRAYRYLSSHRNFQELVKAARQLFGMKSGPPDDIAELFCALRNGQAWAHVVQRGNVHESIDLRKFIDFSWEKDETMLKAAIPPGLKQAWRDHKRRKGIKWFHDPVFLSALDWAQTTRRIIRYKDLGRLLGTPREYWEDREMRASLHASPKKAVSALLGKLDSVGLGVMGRDWH